MAIIEYNRYEALENNNSFNINTMPFVKIPPSPSDKIEQWRSGISRMDKLALKYYDNPLYDFFILYGNPEYLSEFDIEDGAYIRIPFPIDRVKRIYEENLRNIVNT